MQNVMTWRGACKQTEEHVSLLSNMALNVFFSPDLLNLAVEKETASL